MSGGAFLGILLQIIPAFTEVTGVEVLVADRITDRYQFTQNLEQKLCSQSSNPNCEADMRNIPFEEMSGWGSKAFSTNSSDVSNYCIFMTPEFENLATYSNYGFDLQKKYSAISASVGQIEQAQSHHSAMYAALSSLAECARKDSETLDVQVERELAFASLALTLIVGDTSFIREPMTNITRKHANVTNSEAAKYATNIGERILFELWKQETAKVLNKQTYCGPSSRDGGVFVKKSSDINTIGVPRADDWVPTCPYDEERQAWSQSKLEVNDQNLHLFMFGASEAKIRSARGDDGGYGPMQPVVSNPPEPYTPFKPFGSYKSAISYIWETSNNLVGGK